MLGHVYRHCLCQMRANLARVHKELKLLEKFYELGAEGNMTKFYKKLEEIKKSYPNDYRWIIEQKHPSYWALAFGDHLYIFLQKTCLDAKIS